MDFGIMFFSNLGPTAEGAGYDLVVDAARFADRHGFRAVWTPERHFHPFGGLFPNPALTTAALAMVTERIALRAGSLISPLHDTLRIAEEWAVVDRLSGGRVGVSFGSGWNVDDFVFYPDRYESRQRVMEEQIAALRALWGGEPARRPNGAGKPVEITVYPRPVQAELPLWVTSSGNPETFRRAGALGANLLTHLLGQGLEVLEEKVKLYRSARAEHGHDPGSGVVTLMIHTFVGSDLGRVRGLARGPLTDYMRSAVSLERKAAAGGGVISGGHRIEDREVDAGDLENLMEVAFERYFTTSSLIGTPETCARVVWDIAAAGVDEVACLIDFGVAGDEVMRGLIHLDELRLACQPEVAAKAAQVARDAFLDDLEET